MISKLISSSIKKGVSYSTYRTLIKGLLVEGKSTGNEQSEALLEYSILNDKRMDRLDKTLKISEETSNALNKLTDNFTLLVLAEGWCGDAAQILPVINKIAESSSKIELKIVCRDENEGLMNQFLTNGGKAIPKVIVVNNKNEVVNSWGPRPSVATKMVNDYKVAHGGLDDTFKKDLQIWYNKDKGNNTQKDLLNILETSAVEVS
ncbi:MULTISPECIES: thioredoxin family protein [Flavobacteriaceae]|uniref:Thioredoxin family protein n=1 Tax=Lutibacter litoralis TaxID=321268 RepID=A0ABV5K164_9FLAO|nr:MULTISPECIES: thioredoxin family protein [Flavobacteriaceae]GGK43351.1 thioredoxin [Lutibacter litoralis]